MLDFRQSLINSTLNKVLKRLHYLLEVMLTCVRWYDPVAQVMQVRSASRIGESDLGVIRKRIEAVRAALASSI